MSEITVHLTDKALNPITDPIEWTAIDATDRFNDPGHGQVTCRALPQVMGALALPGRRVVLEYRGTQFLAGPVERPHGPYQWSGRGVGTVTFHFTSDLGVVLGRRIYPDPSRPWAGQSASDDAHYVLTGRASTAIRTLVNVSSGPGAVAARRVPYLVMGGDPVAGPTVTVRARFGPLGDELRAIVTAAGESVRYYTVVDPVGKRIVFEVATPVDRSGSVVFSYALGNLRSVTYETEIPRVTTALVAGQGEGKARTLLERTHAINEGDHWRIEDLVDRRDTADSAVLAQAGDEATAEGGQSARLATVTVDSPDQRYGEHFRLGDLAITEPYPGAPTTERIRAAHLQATPRGGSLLTTVVGSQAAARGTAWLRQSRALARALGHLQAV